MQTKFTYRVLKWTLLCGFAASLATACVVTTGDGDSDGDAGEGNTNQAGEPSTGGTSSAGTSAGGKGGTASAGTSSGGKGGAGGTTAGGTSAGGAGGSATDGGAPAYVPGLCEADAPTPSMEPSCTLNDADNTTETCRKCLKTSCCADWRSCYGTEPSVACGYGSNADAPGEFECIRLCYLADMSTDDAQTILGRCEGECLDQCEADGFADAPTQALLDCGQEKCLADCFTP